MSKTKIITDSGSDIPLDLIQKYNIGVVSLTVRFGKEEVIDTVKLTPEEFWTKFKSCSADSMPETAAPSPIETLNESMIFMFAESFTTSRAFTADS